MAAIVKSVEVRVARTQYAVPGWGSGELWTSEEAVVAHDFRFDRPATSASAAQARAPARASAPMGAAEPPSGTLAAPAWQLGNDFVPTSRTSPRVDPDSLVERFETFLSGRPVSFDDVPLDLDHSTAFQRSVAEVLRKIPRGEVVTYAELAALAGYPRAHRAAGTFCAGNRFMFLLPCHRVVAAHGIGGYGSAGVEVKRRLLALEGVHL